ncbi:MAG: septal ring lytic transglycosylase RlpA family protein [Leptolyngbya sp. SIO1E4]|nr:septal ring lytic transglycosylase RlpA family protein [Leptolyngbya sp. SIO1E4]
MGMEFSPLSPVIGTGLSSIEPPVEEGLQPPGSEYLASLNQWHSWDAIAAVRITESGAQVTPEDSFSNLDTHQCAADSAAAYQANTAATSPTPKLQVWVHNHFIGEVTGRAAARQLADNLRLLIKQGKLDAAHLQPIFGANFVGGSLHSDILFIVDESLKSHPEVPAAAIAVQWINNLRIAFDESPLDLVQVQMAMKGLIETSQALYGTASWYGPGFHGRQTANGERFDENALTAAHKTLPFNTHLKVTNRLNGKSVVVRINDRGPYIGNRTLDLSRAAARCLGSVGNGVVPYEAVVLESVPKPELEELTTAQLTADIDLGD